MSPPPTQLDDDILNLILQQLYDILPQSLLSTCRVSRRFQALTTPLLYRSISVGSRKPVKVNAGGDLYTLENEADTEVNGSRDILSSSACNRLDKVKRYTREIVVRGHADWNVLEEVLMTMQHLGHLKWAWWAESLPELVLSTLRRCWPNAHLSLAGLRVNTISNVLLLHMVISQGSGQPLPNGYPQNYKLLMHCRNLWSLAAIVNDGLESGLRRLKDVLVTNPNLKELHLAQRKVGMNIVSSFSRFSFMSEGNAKFPNLHRLELESFHFNSAGSRLWELSHLRHLELRNVQLNPFFDIVRAQDLKHLRVLRLEERCFAGASAPREKLADFLMNLPSGLECLSLSQVVGRIPISLMAITHGMTLRSLVLQESLAWMHTGMTSAGPDNPLEDCPMLSVADLNLLGMECSCLETLLLDMPRTTEWPSDHLDALARLPTLRSLTLYSATNTNPHDQTTNPAQQILQVNKSTARDLFLRLRAAKQGLPLEKLHLNLGEWGRIRYKSQGECLHPMDERCGNLFTCEIEAGTVRVVVRDEREEMRGTLTEEDMLAFKQFE